jgi:hypothetical protein
LLPGKQYSEPEVEKLLREILEVLAVVHQQGVIHRDIKPQNLMRRNRDRQIALVDFGAVKEIGTLIVDPQGHGTTTIAIGTADYMPSEQSYGNPRFASDIYAVGVIGIQALLGELPQKDPATGELLWQDRVQVSPKFAKFLETMVRYDFRQRHHSATEALKGLVPTQVDLSDQRSRRQKLGDDSVNHPREDRKPVLVKLITIASGAALVVMGIGWGLLHSEWLPCQLRLGAQKISDSTTTNIYNFAENGLALLEIDNKWGFINRCGHVAIDPQFKQAWTFKQGVAIIKDNGDQYGYIDSRGKYLFPMRFNWANSFYEGLAAVRDSNNLYGFIDKSGSFTVQPSYKDVGNFSAGVARVQNENGIWGYINSNGSYKIQPRYLDADDFSGRYALVKNNTNGWIYIDIDGKTLEIPSVTKIRSFSEDLAAVSDSNNRWGYINTSGQYAIQPQFSYAGDFAEGLAIVQRQNNLYGYIDKNGQSVISSRFSDAWKFEDGVAIVKETSGRYSFIDRTGRAIFPEQFEDAYAFEQGIALVKDVKTAKWGFIDRDGKFIIKPKFDQAYAE